MDNSQEHRVYPFPILETLFKLNSKFIPLMQNMGFKGFPVPPGIKQMNYPSI